MGYRRMGILQVTHTSRSKIVAQFLCPRYRYLRYHYGGKGLQKVSNKHPTNAGLMIHAMNAQLLNGVDVDTVVSRGHVAYSNTFEEQFSSIPHAQAIRQEQLCMIEGSVRAFARARLPQLVALGAVVAIEREQSVPMTPTLVYDFRADAIIRAESGLIVVDFKPSPYGGYTWVKQWERNHQVLAYVWATQQLYPDDSVLGVQIEGYVRGMHKFDPRFGRKIQQSPLCYVYVNEFSGQIAPDYQASGGWTKTPLWDTSLSTKEYIEEFLTREQVEGLFLAPVPPICPTPQQVQSWLRQTVAQEDRVEDNAARVEDARQRTADPEVMANLFEVVLDINFPQNMDACLKYGSDYECEMAQYCFNKQVAQEPLASGLYEDRVDHHQTEDTE